MEPGATLAWEGPIRLALHASCFHGVQDVLSGTRNVYVSPSVGGSIPLADTVGLDWSLSGGRKVFTESDPTSNLWDVLAGVGVPVAVGSSLTVTPALRAAWTDLEGGGLSDGLVAFGALNAAVSF